MDFLDYFKKKKTPETSRQAMDAINTMDFNKVSEKSPIIGLDNDATGVDNLEDAQQMVADYNAEPEKESKIGSAVGKGISALGEAMSDGAANIAKVKPPQMAQFDDRPVDAMDARRKALMELISRGR